MKKIITFFRELIAFFHDFDEVEQAFQEDEQAIKHIDVGRNEKWEIENRCRKKV